MPYFVKRHREPKSKYTVDEFIGILKFLVEYIFVAFALKVSQYHR